MVKTFKYIIFAINFEYYVESHKNRHSIEIRLCHFAMQNRQNKRKENTKPTKITTTIDFDAPSISSWIKYTFFSTAVGKHVKHINLTIKCHELLL